jgi:hypothetical protein
LQQKFVVEAAFLAGEPTVAEVRAEGLRVGDGLYARAFLGDIEPQPARGGMVFVEPGFPRLLGRESDYRQVRFVAHDTAPWL